MLLFNKYLVLLVIRVMFVMYILLWKTTVYTLVIFDFGAGGGLKMCIITYRFLSGYEKGIAILRKCC